MIRWASLIASPTDGTIDYVRVRSLASVLLALGAGVMAVWVVFIARQINEALVSIAVAALVLPLTGGKIADGLSGRSASSAIQAGTQPGRRASDPGITPAP
jgi:hypothetical protein